MKSIEANQLIQINKIIFLFSMLNPILGFSTDVYPLEKILPFVEGDKVLYTNYTNYDLKEENRYIELIEIDSKSFDGFKGDLLGSSGGYKEFTNSDNSYSYFKDNNGVYLIMNMFYGRVIGAKNHLVIKQEVVEDPKSFEIIPYNVSKLMEEKINPVYPLDESYKRRIYAKDKNNLYIFDYKLSEKNQIVPTIKKVWSFNSNNDSSFRNISYIEEKSDKKRVNTYFYKDKKNVYLGHHKIPFLDVNNFNPLDIDDETYKKINLLYKKKYGDNLEFPKYSVDENIKK